MTRQRHRRGSGSGILTELEWAIRIGLAMTTQERKLLVMIAEMVRDLHHANTARLLFDVRSEQTFEQRKTEYLARTSTTDKKMQEIVQAINEMSE